MTKLIFVVFLALPTIILAGDSEKIPECLSKDSTFSMLVDIINKSGMKETLEGAGPFSMLAPRNEAFEIMNEDAMKELLASPDLMKKFMERITIPQTLEASDLTDGATIKTSGSETLTVTKSGEDITFTMFNSHTAKIVKPDITCSNGVIHPVDQVLD